MATVGGYINAKFARFRIELSSTEMEVLLLNNGLESATIYTAEMEIPVETAIINIIPELLLLPDKKQADAALTWDREAIQKYYSIKCAELGLPDLLNEPEGDNYNINDLSGIW